MQLWRALFPAVELWEAEQDAHCVRRSRERGQLEGIHVVVGDQADRTVLTQWMRESGGGFDAIIDDGGHQNHQLLTSFDALWPHVRPGGLYFLEDLHVGRHQDGAGATRAPAVADVMQAWMRQLVQPAGARSGTAAAHPDDPHDGETDRDLNRDPAPALPSDVRFVACQAQACVVAKL